MTYQRGKAIGKRHGAWLWKKKWWFAATTAVMIVLLAGPTLYALASTRNARYADLTQVPKRHVGIVFGAGVEPDGTPTDYLKKRLDTAVHLYQMNTIEVLLLSGDNSTSHHNEPLAMQRYVVAQGVPASATVLDYAGFNTYDTCYRARAIFGLHDAVLVSHAYHLPRAVTTCNHTGVRSVGAAAENAGTVGKDFSVNYLLRELVSTDKAMLQLVFKPQPTVLGDHVDIP
jgi:vancomycin permeability regulator SanA